MVALRQFVVRVVLGFAALVVSRALLEIAHVLGWYPERQLAALIMTPPSAAAIQTALWIIAAIVAVALWFGADYFLYRRKGRREIARDRSSAKFEDKIGSPTTTQGPPASFRLVLDANPSRIGDYTPVSAINITNIGPVDLDSRCLVSMEEFSGTWPPAMPKPLVLRTDGQIRGQRSGRFTLSKSQSKKIPLLFCGPVRKNEWYFFDENGGKHFLPAGPIKLVLRVYGGAEPITALVFIDTDAGWKAFPRLDIVPASFKLREDRSTAASSTRDWPIRELFAFIRPDLPLTSVQKIGPNVTIDNLDERWKPVGACVLKQLSLGKLHASGREHRRRRLQAAPIAAEFWRTARFTYWFLDSDGKDVLHAESDDGAQYSEIEVSGSEASEIWGRISLRDAAINVHEELRDIDGFFNQGKTPDEKLDHVALYILQAMPIEVKKPPATKWELLSDEEANQLMPGGGATWLGDDFNNEATRIVEARVKRKDVDRVISELKQS
jgi:hypothetical protein